jgi:hypothetical protein
MVGGYIVDIVADKPDHFVLEIRCANYSDRRQVKVSKIPDFFPNFGDAIWWRGKYVYWTPKSDGTGRQDVKIPRIGYADRVDKP